MQLPSPSPSPDTQRFGRFELQRSERRLLFDSRPVVLGARAFDLLVVLAERPGELVGKNELLDRVWPGLVVEEGNIPVQVNALRKVLGSELIGTVPGRGYRFTARIEGKAAEQPAMAVPAPDPLQTRLPRALPALLGRAGDLATLGALVDGHALVSVTGAGGIGKSLLVQHLLDARRRAHRHGVCWVELASVADAAALPATVAEALGVRLGGGDPFAALALAVGPLDLLLALDNAEHLRDDVGRLAALLLDAAPGLKLVVTSQVRLGVASERVLRLSTLDLPPDDAGVEQALASGAVALFLDRAQAADARFALSDANVASVVSVCRAVDGLPLAIELAAARAPMLGIHGLASSMGDRLQLLTRNRNRAAPARQQTLRATLEWSHGFLDETEQAVFRRLAVVVGSCSLQLAQQIAADAAGVGPIDAWAVLDALDVLVDRSLVAVLPGDDDASPRYRLLESPKAFALERLAAAGEVEATQLRLAQAVSSLLAEAWDAYLSGRFTNGGMQQSLTPDCDNARAALAVAQCPASVRLQISAVLQRALPRTLVDEKLAHADACEALLEAEPSIHLRTVGWLSTTITWLTRRQRSRAAAERALTFARDYERLTGDRGYLYAALGVSAFAMAWNNELDSASTTLAEMRALEEPASVPRHLMLRNGSESIIAGFRGDHAEVLRLARERVARAADAHDEMVSMTFLIHAELAAGDARAATTTGRAVVAKLASGRDEIHLTMARLNLCAALLALDAVAEARSLANAAWSQAGRHKLQWAWADYLALLTALERRPAAAARLCGYSTAAYGKFEERREVNEAAAFDRACRLAASALGDTEFERLQAEGRSLREEDIEAIAFGSGDA
jgi:predicted ATPase/DNA-binding winged helix-turn-helix (wHTH) protein